MKFEGVKCACLRKISMRCRVPSALYLLLWYLPSSTLIWKKRQSFPLHDFTRSCVQFSCHSTVQPLNLHPDLRSAPWYNSEPLSSTRKLCHWGFVPFSVHAEERGKRKFHCKSSAFTASFPGSASLLMQGSSLTSISWLLSFPRILIAS